MMLRYIFHQSHRWSRGFSEVVGNVLQAGLVPNKVQVQWLSITPVVQKKATGKPSHLRAVQSIILHYYKTEKPSDINTFLSKNPKLRSLDKEQFDGVMSLLKSQNYSWENIRDHKEVLTFVPNQIQDRLKFLSEFCVTKPRLHELVFAQAYMNSTVGFLRKYGVYSEGFDIIKYVTKNVTSLELPKTFVSELQEQYGGQIEEVLLQDIYYKILRKYLLIRFPSDPEAINLLMNSDWQPTWKPLSAYRDICDIIINTLGLDISYVISNPCILDIDPLSVNKLLDDFSSLGDVPIKKVAVEVPELLLIPFPKIKRWADILWKYKVTKFKFTMPVLRLFRSNDFKDAEARLKALSKLPEWKILSLSPQLFIVLKRPHGLKRLLDTLHSGHALTNFMPASQEPSQRKRRLPQEMATFLGQELNIEEYEANELVNTELRSHFGIANTRMVLELLFNFGFTREQILNGISLLNFEYLVVYEGLMQFPNRPEAQPFFEWMENPQVLHLLAYCIKKAAPHLQLSADR